MDARTLEPTLTQDSTTTQEPYSRYGDGEFLVYFLVIAFSLAFLAYIYKIVKWCRLKQSGPSQTTSLPDTTNYIAPQTQYPNSEHLPEEWLQEIPRAYQTRVQYPNSVHLPVETLHERSRANSSPFPNLSTNLPRIRIAYTESESHPPAYESSIYLSPSSVEQAERARSRSVANIPVPHYRNFQNQFPTSPISFPRENQTESLASPPPTYNEALRTFPL